MTIDTAKIRAEAEAATPGPWLADRDNGLEVVTATNPPLVVANLARVAPEEPMDDADLAFIASARTNVPALCDEVDRLRAENATMREVLTESQRAFVVGLEEAKRQARDDALEDAAKVCDGIRATGFASVGGTARLTQAASRIRALRTPAERSTVEP